MSDDLAPSRGGEPEHERDHDVLEDEDGEHEIGLVVARAGESRSSPFTAIALEDT